MRQTLLVLDPGSSSLKFGLYLFDEATSKSAKPYPGPELLAEGAIERLGSPQAEFRLNVPGSHSINEATGPVSAAQAVEVVLNKLPRTMPSGIVIERVGCRVVHGGDRFTVPTLVTPEVVAGIRELSPLAPLHNPTAADVLEACSTHLPNAYVVAVFDTTFHRTMSDVARTYALPVDLCRQHGLRRFGFHGIAHQYVSERLLESIEKVGQASRCITCHLGSGASICAVRDGESIDTSMGMTPMEGLMMGTRSGDVDPGLLLYLLRTVEISANEMDVLLEHKSGLLGVSGLSSDVRDLELAAANGDKRAEFSLNLFAYRVAKTIGSYVVALEGVDAVAFSGGIGEHSPQMRNRICSQLACLGITLDDNRNRGTTGESQLSFRISSDDSRIQVWVINANENLQIAHTVNSLGPINDSA